MYPISALTIALRLEKMGAVGEYPLRLSGWATYLYAESIRYAWNETPFTAFWLCSESVPPFGSSYVSELGNFSIVLALMNRSRRFNIPLSLVAFLALRSLNLDSESQAFLYEMKNAKGRQILTYISKRLPFR